MIIRKSDIIEEVANKADMSKSAAAEAVNAVIDTILNALAKNDTISITGFGTFKTDSREARAVRNPATGGTVNIPAHQHPKFTFAESVRTAFRDSEQSKYLK